MRAIICIDYSGHLRKLIWLTENTTGISAGICEPDTNPHATYHVDGTYHHKLTHRGRTVKMSTPEKIGIPGRCLFDLREWVVHAGCRERLRLRIFSRPQGWDDHVHKTKDNRRSASVGKGRRTDHIAVAKSPARQHFRYYGEVTPADKSHHCSPWSVQFFTVIASELTAFLPVTPSSPVRTPR
jgi:hypothetical protein